MQSIKPPSSDRGSDWADSPFWLDFLGRWRAPREAGDACDWEASRLKLSAAQAIDLALIHGALEVAPLLAIVESESTAAELRKHCKRLGLKQAGLKSEVVSRLIDAARAEMEQLYGQRPKLILTTKAAAAVARHWCQQMELEADAMRQCRAALEVGDHAAAISVVSEFESTNPRPRGLWLGGAGPLDCPRLPYVTEARPSLLGHLSEATWRSLHVAAGMMELWGTSKAAQWLPEDLALGSLDAECSVRMVLFAGHATQSMDEARRGGCSHVVIDVVCDWQTCASCRLLEGKRFRLKDAPELPNPTCTCEAGCRCMFLFE